jgi:phospholipase/carboxylesterase
MSNKIILIIIIQFSFALACISQNNNNTVMTDTSLHYIIRESKNKDANSSLLILLHGHASNENDLFSFNTQIPDNWIVVSVRAPYKLSEGSYRWYDVKMVNDKIRINTEEEEKSRKRLLWVIESITKKYKVDTHSIVIAGFSQGANMASAISLTTPEKIAGFGVFSGRFIEEVKPFISRSVSLKSLKCFLAHGSRDYMLPIAYAKENQQELQSLGISVTFSEDTVAHSISSKQFGEFLQWLNQF